MKIYSILILTWFFCLSLYAGDKGLSKTVFHEVINNIVNIYSPVVEKLGANLLVKRNWEDNAENAYADQKNGNWILKFSGGYARKRGMTRDAFSLIVCHELGHHLGGSPLRNDWASSEGQADYWASFECFKNIFQKDNNVLIITSKNIDPQIEIQCKKSFRTKNNIALCVRTAIAAKELFNLKTLEKDESIIFKTLDMHPGPQCRFDTTFAGALCNKETICERKMNSSQGVRPLCWFRPKSDESLTKEELHKDLVDNLSEYAGVGNLIKIKEASLLSSFDVNKKNKYGMTAFFKAASNGYLNIVKYLLTFEDILINETSSNKITVLSEVTKNNHMEMAKFLISDLQIDVNETYMGRGTPLYTAVELGLKSFVEYFVTVPTLNVNSGYSLFENTPLMLAADNNEVNIVKILLSHKDIDINYTNRYGDNALSLAKDNDNHDIVNLLLLKK